MTLRVEHLSVSINEHAIVDDVSLSVASGEIVAILGSSGEGKTTLLRAIAGLVVPDSGSVFVDDVDITLMATHLRPVGMMLQNYALFPHLNVRQNVEFGLKMMKIPAKERRQRADALLERFAITSKADRKVTELSGGEQQRVALARSLARQPRVLLLDEPMGSLDRVLRDRLIDELAKELQEQSLSIVMVTHDRTDAFALAHRIAIFENHSIAQIGTKEELQKNPVSHHAALLLGVENRAD